MKKEKEFYVVEGGASFNCFNGRKTYTHGQDTDFYVFTGGADVDPALYGESKHYSTHVSEIRDRKDNDIYSKIDKKKLKVGICRGAQFLTVKSGGSLIQDVSNHRMTTDEIMTLDGSLFIESDHHQMMYPFEVDNHVIIATSVTPKSTYYLNGNNKEVEMPFEPEIVYYPNTNSLCIQGHPEWGSPYAENNKKLRAYINKLIDHYVNKLK